MGLIKPNRTVGLIEGNGFDHSYVGVFFSLPLTQGGTWLLFIPTFEVHVFQDREGSAYLRGYTPCARIKSLSLPDWCPHLNSCWLSLPSGGYLEDGIPSDSSLHSPVPHSQLARLGLSVNSTVPTTTLPGSLTARGLVLGCAFSSRAGLPLIPKKIGRFHRPLWPLVPSGRSYHFPMETGPDHWAPCVLLHNGACSDAKHGALLSACQQFDENHPVPRNAVPEPSSGSEI